MIRDQRPGTTTEPTGKQIRRGDTETMIQAGDLTVPVPNEWLVERLRSASSNRGDLIDLPDTVFSSSAYAERSFDRALRRGLLRCLAVHNASSWRRIVTLRLDRPGQQDITCGPLPQTRGTWQLPFGEGIETTCRSANAAASALGTLPLLRFQAGAATVPLSPRPSVWEIGRRQGGLAPMSAEIQDCDESLPRRSAPRTSPPSPVHATPRARR